MKKLIFNSAFAIGIFVLASCGNSGSENPGDTLKVSDTIVSGNANGKAIFETKCTACHGSDGKAGIMGAFDLTTSTVNHEGMVAIIKNGRNAMKAFANEMTAEEIEAVATYAESLKK